MKRMKRERRKGGLGKALRFVLGCLLLLSVMPASLLTHSEEYEEYLCTLREETDMVVEITWDTEMPRVILVSPDGNRYDISVTYEETRSAVYDGGMTYCIFGAVPGDWTVIYDKLGNENISIEYLADGDYLTVESVQAYMEDTKCHVSFRVTSDSDYLWYNYTIYVSTDTGSRGAEMRSGSAMAGDDPVYDTFDMSEIGSYDSYYVYVYAYANSGDFDIYDGAYSSAFSYQNPNIPENDTEGLFLTVYPDEYTAVLQWEPYYSSSYLAAFYGKTVRTEGEAASYTDEPDYYDELTGNEENTVTYVYNLAEEIRVTFSEQKRYSPYSAPKIFTVDLQTLPKLLFEDAEITNHRVIEASYDGFSQRTPVSISNGTGTSTVFAEGSGTFEIGIPEGESTVTAVYQLTDDIRIVYEKTFYRDTEPPRIYMTEDYTDVYTEEDSFTVMGTVSDAVTFTVGGAVITPDADGSFLYNITLTEGVNVLDVIAADGAGNSALYTIRITKGGSGAIVVDKEIGNIGRDDDAPKSPLSFLTEKSGIMQYAVGAAALLLALVIGLIATFTWKKGKKTDVVKTLHRLFASAALVSAGFSVYQFIMWRSYYNYNNKLSFVETVTASSSKAYRLLETELAYRTRFIYGAVITGILIVLLAVLMFGIRKLLNVRSRKTSGIPSSVDPSVH